MKFKNSVLFVLVFSLFFIFSCEPEGNKESGGVEDENDAPGTGIIVDPPTSRVKTDDWRDEIIYFIMTDRFKDGDTSNNPAGFTDRSKIHYYHGGDLQGIMAQVDYIRKVGATAIWITPVVSNIIEDNQYAAYHGYWAWDMSTVNENLAPGSMKDNTTDRFNYYKSFVDTMHDNGILVIQDVVVNHMGNIVGYGSPAPDFWDPPYSSTGYPRMFVETKYPPATAGNEWVTTGRRTIPPAPFNDLTFYHNRGKIGNYDNATQAVYGDMAGLDDIATDLPAVRTALIDIYTKWMEAGIDGFRLDTVKHVESSFWDEFSLAMRVNAQADSKKFIQFGEALIGDHSQTAQYVSGNRLDSLLNFDLFYKIRTVFAQGGATSKLTDELSNRSSLRNIGIGSGGAEISAQEGVINFVDNHDDKRFLSSVSAGNGELRLRNALMYLMTTQGIPCIYYNTENDVLGADNDLGRVDMPNFKTSGKPTLTLINKLSTIRKDNIALRRGDIVKLKDSTGAGIFAFGRGYVDAVPANNQNMIVAINTSAAQITENIAVSTYASDGDVLEDIFSDAKTAVTVSSGEITATIPAFGVCIFKKQ